jgi:hypothetical protein
MAGFFYFDKLSRKVYSKIITREVVEVTLREKIIDILDKADSESQVYRQWENDPDGPPPGDLSALARIAGNALNEIRKLVGQKTPEERKLMRS